MALRVCEATLMAVKHIPEELTATGKSDIVHSLKRCYTGLAVTAGRPETQKSLVAVVADYDGGITQNDSVTSPTAGTVGSGSGGGSGAALV